MTILIIDDESPIRELIQYNAEREGFTVLTATNGAEAISFIKSAKIDGIILDLMLPDMNGLDLCRILKTNTATSNIPIIMVTAKTEDIDIVSGLEIGADDYITKPFSPKVLIARIRAVLRRKENADTDRSINRNFDVTAQYKISDELIVGNIRIIQHRHEVFSYGRKIVLSAVEFSILHFLAEHQGQVFSRQEIINAVKGKSYPVTDRAVDVHILNIRRKIEDTTSENSVIETIRGVGYRMREL